MDTSREVSVKGYYYRLEKSPYEFTSPYGDVFKLPSRKRLEMMHRQTKEALARCEKFFARNGLEGMPEELKDLTRKYVIEAVYRSIVE